MAVIVRGGDAPPCEWCVLSERHGHILNDDGTLGIVVLTNNQPPHA